jgi:hypothetical protein
MTSKRTIPPKRCDGQRQVTPPRSHISVEVTRMRSTYVLTFAIVEAACFTHEPYARARVVRRGVLTVGRR